MTKREVATLLRRYDKLRQELRTLEHDLAKGCVDYGRTQGIWGFNKDHLRMEIERGKAHG